MANGMSKVLQHHPTVGHGVFWTFATGILLVAFLAVLQIPSPARPARSDQLFYSDETTAIARVLDSAFAAVPDTGYEKRDTSPTLFGMDVELVNRGEVLNKWSHARAEIARELQ